jgi:hypothetical protein
MDAENRRHSQSPNGELFFLQSAFWIALSEAPQSPAGCTTDAELAHEFRIMYTPLMKIVQRRAGAVPLGLVENRLLGRICPTQQGMTVPVSGT